MTQFLHVHVKQLYEEQVFTCAASGRLTQTCMIAGDFA